LKAALAELGGDPTPAAERIRQEYGDALGRARHGADARDTPDNLLRRRLVRASRAAVADLRITEAIGDAAYRRIEEELDWLELSAGVEESRT
jgi:CPA1 family monovalent cation:H+ antiporter